MMIEAGAPFTQAALKFADREAIRAGGASSTFRELREAANRAGSALAGLGIAPGDRVAILSFNRTEVVELWLGLERFNLVRVVLHSHFDMATHVHTLNEVGAKALIFDGRFSAAVDAHRSAMRSVKALISLDEAPSWALSYRNLSATGNPGDPRLDIDEEAPCFLQLTSGTTGVPKPWVHTHRSWRAVIANNLEHLDTFGDGIPAVGPDDVNLHFHALQWATGFQTLMPYLLRGARTVLVDDEAFDPARVADAIMEEGVTGTLVPGPMLPSILDAIAAHKAGRKAMRRMVIFFATPELLERTTKLLGPIWCHGFGSTEQGAPTTRLTAQDLAASPKRLESVGRAASPFFEMAVVDEKGRRLPAGGVGEIVVRSAMSTSAYWQSPARTAEAFFPGDWFRPNDIGYIDEDGFLYYLDRAKDRISTPQGVVYPHVVETALLRHEAVANCGVVGTGGEGAQAVIAGVLLKAGVSESATLASEIMALASESLSVHERPTRIIFVTALPTVLGGAKVRREVLQKQLAGA